ncbi:MAG: FAD-dependent oxidoreductase [Bdellovibrionota bacterium]
MPNARQITCDVTQIIWPTPTVMQIRFRPSKPFTFKPGQFLSILVPPDKSKNHKKAVKRAYSFSSAPNAPEAERYELCVKYVKGGIGTEFLKSLKVGDTFKAMAPYGDFEYLLPKSGRSVCFISTGTGIAPFKSIVLSKEFAEHFPKSAYCLFGAPTKEEIIYPGLFESKGVKTVYALDLEKSAGHFFKGRVTDFLKALPRHWHWHSTDFYLCGNPMMVDDVVQFLKGAHGVDDSAIHRESFAAPTKKAEVTKSKILYKSAA